MLPARGGLFLIAVLLARGAVAAIDWCGGHPLLQRSIFQHHFNRRPRRQRIFRHRYFHAPAFTHALYSAGIKLA